MFSLYNMTRQDTLYAVAGGIFLGLATSMFFILFGRIFHLSKLITDSFTTKITPNIAMNLIAFCGIIFSSASFFQLYHEHYLSYWPFDSESDLSKIKTSILIVSGFLVGLGTALAQGGKVQHILIGLPRMRLSSYLAAILIGVSVYYTNEWKLAEKISPELGSSFPSSLPKNISGDSFITFSLVVPFLFFILTKDRTWVGLLKYIFSFCSGIVLGIGLLLGGEVNQKIVHSSMTYNLEWNPRILVFMGVALLINFIIFNIMIRKRLTPIFSVELENPESKITFGLIFGSIIFGTGWGLSGISSSTFYMLITSKNIRIPLYWGAFFIFGSMFGKLLRMAAGKITKKKVPGTK